MAELVDAPDSKSSSSNGVWVRFPLRPPKRPNGRFFYRDLFVIIILVFGGGRKWKIENELTVV